MPEEDEPLDPQIEALRLRLMRLLRGGLILGFGALAVVVALVYRFAGPADRAAPPPPAPGAAVAVALPEGARVVGTAVGTDRLALTLELPDGRTVIRVVDTGGRPIVTYTLGLGPGDPAHR